MKRAEKLNIGFEAIFINEEDLEVFNLQDLLCGRFEKLFLLLFLNEDASQIQVDVGFRQLMLCGKAWPRGSVMLSCWASLEAISTVTISPSAVELSKHAVNELCEYAFVVLLPPHCSFPDS